MPVTPTPSPEIEARIQELIELYPALADRLARQLLVTLHNKGHATIDAIYDEARGLVGEAPVERERGAIEPDPNAPSAVRWEGDEREAVRRVTFRRAAAHLSGHEVEEALNLVRRREAAESLEGIATLPDVPARLLAERVKRFVQLPAGDERLNASEVMGTRVALLRNVISDQLEFIGVAKNFLRIRDFDWILDRIIGPDRGQGRIGGKAAGMFLGYRILQGATHEHRDAVADVHLPESWFLRSDVIRAFMRLNGLEEYQSQKYKDADVVRSEYPIIRQVFQNGEFPAEIVQKLEKVLEGCEGHPLVIRSSSLLEDRFGTAFSGMYASVFLGNQGRLKARLKALLGAIAEVFASTLGPDPILYRRRHNLIDYDEDMAVLIQKVVGRRHGRFFLPDAAGVGFSRNEYRWSPRLKSEDGMARLVLGLGTRAVDRTGNDYPRIVALGAPRLRPEGSVREAWRHSQRQVDTVDLAENRFRTVPLHDLVAEGPEVPGLEMAASVWTGDGLIEPTGRIDGIPADELALTFDRLVGRTPFASLMRDRLRRLEDAYGVPINLEFAQVEDRFFLLQCRPLVQAQSEACRIPDVPPDRRVFGGRGMVRSGMVRDIEYVVYVDPRAYDAIRDNETRVAVARAVGRINDALEGRAFILMGPGRWGSNDSRLGVRASYADVNHCKVLVEIAHRKGTFLPEVSYGTHFFQEMVEEGIYCLPLYPDEPGSVFDAAFFGNAPNALPHLVPRDADLEGIIRVIRVAAAAPGRSAHLAMDGDAGESLCWLE